LRVNKSLLIGKKLKKYFSGFGGTLGTVTGYLLDHNTYPLKNTDGHVDIIPFSNISKHIPKSWKSSIKEDSGGKDWTALDWTRQPKSS
jgi:hypothetical protein